MRNIPKRVEDRLITRLKKFQPILAVAKSRDVNESDLVVILNDVFADVFGYDKYFKVTSEFSIRGTFCDLAIKLENKIEVLIEAKAPGIELKDPQIKQAVDYAANQRVDRVVLTNGIQWEVPLSTLKKWEQETRTPRGETLARLWPILFPPEPKPPSKRSTRP
jgi:hypothetical protein